MCWNNTEAGAKAAALHVKSIMTPTSYCYFDYYQTSETNGEPIAIGGYLPVKKVYSLEPVLPSIPENEKKYVYGVQANLWSEYIPTFSQVEYMVLPRMAALSEVQWCRSSSRNYDSFLRRIPRLVKIYDLYGYKYAKHIFGVKSDIKTDFSEGNVVVALNTIDNATIYYNINGGKAEKYDTPLTIKKSCEISAYAEREGKATDTISHKFLFSKSTTRPLTLKNKPYEEYTFGGGRTLVDGVVATCYNYSSGKWIGFYNTDLDATIELAPAGKKAPEISEVSVNNSISKASGVFDARALEIYVSADGKDFNKIYEKEYPQMKQDGNDRYIVTHKADFEKTNANYVRIIEKGERHMPDFITWGKGEPAFLFADEITVN
jgi:hexosaminidase